MYSVTIENDHLIAENRENFRCYRAPLPIGIVKHVAHTRNLKKVLADLVARGEYRFQRVIERQLPITFIDIPMTNGHMYPALTLNLTETPDAYDDPVWAYDSEAPQNKECVQAAYLIELLREEIEELRRELERERECGTPVSY